MSEITTTPHTSYCKDCPSKYGPDDPESIEISNYTDGVKQKFVFPCAWRPNKLCKGVCENLNYKEKIHSSLLEG